jgi:site-specific recombinase XerD
MPRVPKPWFREDRQAYFVTIGGVRHNLGADKKAADKKFHELMAADTGTPKSSAATPATSNGMTVAEVFDKYLDWCQKHRSPRTYEWTQKHIQQFCTHLGKACHTTFGELRPFHIVEWVDKKTTWGANQKRGAIIAVQRPFSWALKLGYIERNPVAGVEKPKAKRRDAYVTPEQFTVLMERYKEGDPFRDLLAFLWETGC